MGTSFVALAMITLLASLLAFVAVFIVGLGGYSDRISKDYAILYGNEIAGELESQLGREITLSVAAAADPDIQDWLLAEDDPALATRAARALTALGRVFQGRDIFLAAAATRNFRFFANGSTVDPSLVFGILSPDNPEDGWFFTSLDLPGDYHLNIDTDRFLRTTRVWVNCPVRAGGRIAGVIGTGLHLDPLVRAILSGHERHGARSILINAYGAIQLDQDLGNITENSYGSPVGVEGTVYSYHDSPSFRAEVERYLRDPREPLALRLSGGEYQYAALVPITGTDWHAVTFFGLGQLYDPRVLVTMGAVLALVLALAVLALSLGMRQLFLRPFRALVESLDRMTADSGASVAGLSRRDEFGSLARSVRDLAERLVQSVPAGMFLLDAEGRFTYGNRYFLRQFGCDDATAFSRRFDADLPGLFRSESDYHLLRRFLHDRRELLVLETQLVDSGGTAFWARLHVKRVKKRSGIEEYEGLLLNIQDQKDNEDRLAAIASTDQLTGLYNRRYLEQWMTVALGKSDRSGERASLVMFDLDNFKRVNDLYGHDAGDEVLVAAAAAAKALLRDADSLIRWGGEEFAAILPNTGLEGALLVAEKLRASLAARPHPKAGVVTASFGVAERVRGEPWPDWFKRADEALYHAKQSGRDRVFTVDAAPAEPHRRAPLRLVWQDSYNSGNGTIDSQHRALFDLANVALGQAVEGDAGSGAKLAGTVKTLYGTLEGHFADEEALLAGIGFPEAELEAHQREHGRLLGLAGRLAEHVACRPDTSVSALLDFVNEVVFRHLLNEDSRFFALTRASGENPSRGSASGT